jgi:SAM-dependent MidA family methyltransferase
MTPMPTSLPTPGPDAAARSALLATQIHAQIAAHGGWMSFAGFMEACLYTPGLGYYSGASTKLGSGLKDDSDFVTAPELSSLFGRALARQVAEVCALTSPQVLEFGAGSGKLACDLLAELERFDALPERYCILELSGDLRARQQALLEQRVPHLAQRVQWLDQLPERLAGVVLANEVLDAMPVHLMVWPQADTAAGWLERGVATGPEQQFVFVDRPAEPRLRKDMATRIDDALEIAPDYLTELNLAAPAFVTSLAERLDHGALLLIDYGFPVHEYFHVQRHRGTLMAHYRHRAHDNPLILPGLQDLTAHVDFSAIAQAGVQAGLELLGYTSQAHFLINCGITELIEGDPSQPAIWLPQTNALQRLISEAEMGELFKVIALGRGLPDGLLGFRRGDRSHTL